MFFLQEKYDLKGEVGHKASEVVAYGVNPSKLIGSWKVAWTTARELADVSCRWHDCRHSFVSTLAEGQASDTTIMALAAMCQRR
jgi:hypothetical protein